MDYSAAWKRRLRWLWQKLRGFFTRSPGFPPPADPALLRQIQGWFAEHLAKHPEIPIERRGEYARAAGVIFERMTPTALVRLRRHVMAIQFYVSLEEMTVELAPVFPEVAMELARGLPIGGLYHRSTRALHLDGGDDEDVARDIFQLIGHEFSHAVDGPRREITSSKEWQEAWRAEIVPKQLSLRGLVSPQEGFAELGRFMYSGYYTRRFMERRFSRCIAVWRGHGLW